MSSAPLEPSGKFVEPDRQMARTLGILHIVFGLILLLGCNVLGGGMSLLLGAGMPFIDKAVEQERRDALKRIEHLEQEEQATDDEDERQGLADQRERLEREVQQMPHFSKLVATFSSVESIVYYVVDQGLGIPLNLAMIVAGIGMLSLRPWGRALAIITLTLKILRLIPQELFFSIVVAPQWARGLGGFVGSMMPPGQAPPGLEAQVTASYMGIYIGMGVAMLLLGPIFPLVALWLLTRPKVKAAFGRPAQAVPPAR